MACLLPKAAIWSSSVGVMSAFMVISRPIVARARRTKDDISRFGVRVNVKLGCRSSIALTGCATHDNDTFDQVGKSDIEKRHGKISGGPTAMISREPCCSTAYLWMASQTFIPSTLSASMGQVKACHAVGTMHFGAQHACGKSDARAAIDRDVPIQKFEQPKSVISRIPSPTLPATLVIASTLTEAVVLPAERHVSSTLVTVQDHRDGGHSDSFPQAAASARRSTNASRSISTKACVLGG